MSVGLSLLAYALLISVLGPLLLRGRGTTRLVPRLGVLAWLAAAMSAVGAGVVGGLALAVPAVPHGVNEFLAACTHAFPGGATAAGGAAARTAGLSVAGAVLGRAAWGVLASLIASGRQRRRYGEAVRIVAQPSSLPGAVVLESDLAVVYCVPGRGGGQVVITSGALRSLSESELDAVLDHEGAHLRGRHHLLLAVLRGLSRAFSGVPLFRQAVPEVGRLLEMCADDVAATRHSPRTLMSALSRLSTGPAPAISLAAATTAVEERVRRLSVPLAGRAGPRTALTVCVVLLAAGPLIAAGVPFAAELAHHLLYCPPPI